MLSFFNVVLFATLALKTVQAAPVSLGRRIDQTISDATAPWQQACEAAGGTTDKCSGIAVPAFTSLLEAGGVCDQQNAADNMIDFAKQLNNNAEMIRLAQIFVQQPRNSPEKTQVPYCQVAPRNAELNGLFHCQFAGSDFSTFAPPGNVPLGLTSLSPAGSCPANPSGPVPDGVQLNTLVTSPGVPGAASAPAPIASPTVAAVEVSATATVAIAPASTTVLSCAAPA